MPLPCLPIEIWQQILEEIISLPTFLDSENLSEVINPLSIGVHYDVFLSDTNYWAVERQRNTLQQVCRSWDAYLRRFEHRYIQMVDIYHGNIPKAALNSAIRVGFGSCLIPNCSYEAHDPVTVISAMDELPVQIISWDVLLDDLQGLFSVAKTVMPHLRIIINEATIDNHVEAAYWTNVVNWFPKLSFLRINGLGMIHWPLITATNLTTLSYEGRIYPFGFPLETVSLPSLRHLRFVGRTDELVKHIDHLVRQLEVVGCNLRSLQLGGYGVHWTAVPQEVWRLCPSLERLDSGLSLHYPPPPGHPLNTVSIPFPHEWKEEMEEVENGVPFPTTLQDWPSLRRIYFFEDKRLLEEDLGPACRSFVLDLIRECKRRCVVIEDATGIVSEEDWE